MTPRANNGWQALLMDDLWRPIAHHKPPVSAKRPVEDREGATDAA